MRPVRLKQAYRPHIKNSHLKTQPSNIEQLKAPKMKLKLLILIASTLLSACSLSHEEAIEKSKASCLNTLHPVKSRDEFISQMFATALEDDCLYHFTPAELEKIWGIPVFDLVPPAAGTDLHKPLNKDIQSPIGLYVEKVDRPKVKEFYVQMTMDELNQSFSIFPEGHFPSILPKPKSFALSTAALTHPPAYIPPLQISFTGSH